MRQLLLNTLVNLLLIVASSLPVSAYKRASTGMMQYWLKPDVILTQPSQIRRPVKSSETFVDTSGFYQGFRYEFQTRKSALLANVPIDRAFSTLPADDPLNQALPITSQLQIALFH